MQAIQEITEKRCINYLIDDLKHVKNSSVWSYFLKKAGSDKSNLLNDIKLIEFVDGLSKTVPGSQIENRPGVMKRREEAILNVLIQLGYEPTKLPFKEGYKGVKAEVEARLNGSADFKSKKGFIRAWERLLDDGRIINKVVN